MHFIYYQYYKNIILFKLFLSSFSKQNITFSTVKHFYVLTTDVNDKKPVFVVLAKQSAT